MGRKKKRREVTAVAFRAKTFFKKQRERQAMAKMAKNLSGALSQVKTFLEKLPFKAPWKVAGPVVSSEWKSADLNVEEYRRSAPGQILSDTPIIPRTTPDKVYDIKYWPRDTKREHIQVGGTNKKFQE